MSRERAWQIAEVGADFEVSRGGRAVVQTCQSLDEALRWVARRRLGEEPVIHVDAEGYRRNVTRRVDRTR